MNTSNNEAEKQMDSAACRTMLQLAWLGYISCALQGPGITYDVNAVDKMMDIECEGWMKMIMAGTYHISASCDASIDDGRYWICLR